MGWLLFLLSFLHTLLDRVCMLRIEESTCSTNVCLECGLGDLLSAGYSKGLGPKASIVFVSLLASQTQSNRKSFHSFTFRRWRLW